MNVYMVLHEIRNAFVGFPFPWTGSREFGWGSRVLVIFQVGTRVP